MCWRESAHAPPENAQRKFHWLFRRRQQKNHLSDIIVSEIITSQKISTQIMNYL